MFGFMFWLILNFGFDLRLVFEIGIWVYGWVKFFEFGLIFVG